MPSLFPHKNLFHFCTKLKFVIIFFYNKGEIKKSIGEGIKELSQKYWIIYGIILFIFGGIGNNALNMIQNSIQNKNIESKTIKIESSKIIHVHDTIYIRTDTLKKGN